MSVESEPPRSASMNELYSYLQQDVLAFIAWTLLVGCWLVGLLFYNPIQALPARWLPALLVVCLGSLLAIVLREKSYQLASGAFVAFLLIAVALVVSGLESAQHLYFAVPIISLATYLVGPRMGAAVLAGMFVVAGYSVSHGIDASPVTPALALGLLTTAVAWLSSRHIYMTLAWAWENYTLSLARAQEAQQHRAQLARTSKSLEEAYDRVHWYNEALAKAWQAAEEARRLKNRFTANVSHELRTPLYIIVGFAETMLFAPESYGRELPAPYRSDLVEIYNSSQHLLHLIDDVLELSQIEAGRMGLVREPADVGEIMQEAAGLAQTLAERKGLVLEVRLPDEPLPTLHLDRVRIRQVLLNLLNNAARYTDRGEIAVEARLVGEEVLISVADTGPGIPSGQLERIFDAYYQADPSLSERRGGVGLGLAISRGFVEMHGGHIRAESRLGSGSRFTFSLPVPKQLPEEERDGSPRLLRTPTQSRDELHAKHVLVIDADRSVARLLQRHLDGWQVAWARDVTAAEMLLQRTRSRAIVTTNRGQADALLEQAGAGSPLGLLRTPLLVCPLPTGPLPALALGAYDYLTKPVARAALLSALERCAPHASRILVVDDEPHVVRLLTRMLSTATGRYEVMRAYDGGEALALLRAEPPDVVLLDLYMPEVDGFSLLEIMAGDPALSQIPVVVVSGKGLPSDGMMQIEGAISLQQPGGFTLTELFSYLQSLLAASSSELGGG